MKRVVQFGGINHMCDLCEKEADWRGRDPKTGDVIAAACKAHKDARRAAILAELTSRKRS